MFEERKEGYSNLVVELPPLAVVPPSQLWVRPEELHVAHVGQGESEVTDDGVGVQEVLLGPGMLIKNMEEQC